MGKDEPVFLLAQLNPDTEEPEPKDLHAMGTVAQVLQVLKLPDGTVKVLVEGIRRARALTVEDTGQLFLAHIEAVNESVDEHHPDMEALRRTLLSQFEQYAKLNKKNSCRSRIHYQQHFRKQPSSRYYRRAPTIKVGAASGNFRNTWHF